MNLKNKTILVTGVASGIGRASAAALSSAGAKVIGVDRTVPAGADAGMIFHMMDLSDPASIDRTVDKLGGLKLDGIANIAGASNIAPIETQFRVNFLGNRYLLQKLKPTLNAGASVVNMASGTALFWREHYDQINELVSTKTFDEGVEWLKKYPQDRLFSYARSKEAMVMWTLRTAVEWVGSGLRINAISPGPVDTPMLQEFRDVVGADIIAADAKRSGRAGRPEDIAPIVAFLMSERSAWIHGANIAADGGFSASVLVSKDGWAY